MKAKKLFILFLTAGALIVADGCKKASLDVTNLNNPSYDVLKTESGIVAFAKGFYKIGFGDQSVESLNDGLGYGMLIIVQGMHESMGDNIWIPWGNNNFKFLDNPLSVTLDNGTLVPNPIGGGQIKELRLRNARAYGPTNCFLNEWTYMYFLNNSGNVLLSKLDGATLAGDAATKKKILQAWSYWWKGYAYSRIGSMYYAGLKVDEANATNGTFISHDAMIAEANANFDKAATILGGLSSGDTYNATLSALIPGYMQFAPDGSAAIPTPAMWIKNINSMKARNLLANKRIKDMAAGDWTQLATLTAAGISNKSDYVFLIKNYSDNSKSITSNLASDGSAAGYTATSDNQTFYVSERLIQDFQAGDKRYDNNFDVLSSPIINMRGRGITFGTRYYLLDGGNSNGAITYYNSTPNVDNFFLAVSFEENTLMKAEVLINTGQIDQGITLINSVRTFQGAGISSPAGLTLAQAKEELRKERRIALLFRGVAFYDLRRGGYTDDVSAGGGRKGAVVLSGTGAVNTNATINYNYLSYWDVPQNELDFNAAASGSAPTKQPN